MENDPIKVGDHVRIVNLLANHKMPVGIVERIDGWYIYVHTPVSDETPKDRCVYEAYENELVKITEEEYFKLILKGANIK
jgi:hypothetical protein